MEKPFKDKSNVTKNKEHTAIATNGESHKITTNGGWASNGWQERGENMSDAREWKRDRWRPSIQALMGLKWWVGHVKLTLLF